MCDLNESVAKAILYTVKSRVSIIWLHCKVCLGFYSRVIPKKRSNYEISVISELNYLLKNEHKKLMEQSRCITNYSTSVCADSEYDDYTKSL